MLCRAACFAISAVIIFFVGGFFGKAVYLYKRDVSREDDFWGIASKARAARLLAFDTTYIVFGIAFVLIFLVLEAIALVIKSWMKHGCFRTFNRQRDTYRPRLNRKKNHNDVYYFYDEEEDEESEEDEREEIEKDDEGLRSVVRNDKKKKSRPPAKHPPKEKPRSTDVAEGRRK